MLSVHLTCFYFVHFTGCPENWVAGQYGCYQLSTGHVTNRDFAVKRCALRGGHLATIENEAENHYLSHAFAGDLNGIDFVYLFHFKFNKMCFYHEIPNPQQAVLIAICFDCY